MKKINVLSLFDGISCARVAIERAGFKTSTYYASEIDSYATQVSEKNYPDIIRLGDIKNLNWNATNRYETIDLLIGGSPCQDLSIANTTRKGLDGARSGLFWEYVRVLKEAKPKYFILENVASMPKEARRIIAETLGVEPIMIDAALVSAQTRKRLFWTNIPGITQPKDRGLIVKDIIEKKVDEKYFISEKTLRNIKKWNNAQSSRIRTMWGKSVTLQAGGGGCGAKTGLYLIVPEATKKGYAIAKDGQSIDLSFLNSKTRRGRVGDKVKNLMTSANIGVFTRGRVRKLTPVECARLQSLPDKYTEGISDSQQYKCLGNGFNADVITHILSFIKK